MFKPGQTVKCIKSDGTPLTTGDLYTISKVFNYVSTGAELCWVKETRGDWYADRFEPINIELSQQHNGETHMSSGGPYIASSVHQQALDKIAQLENALQIATQSLVNINKPQYTPPSYIKSGWWIAMDADGTWWVFERKPIVDMQYLEWTCGGACNELPIITGTDESMWHVPNDQWQQTLLQIP